MWVGNEPANFGLFTDIEEGILSQVPQSILLKELWLRVNRGKKFIPFPKKIKEESDMDWLKEYYKKFYNYSNKEIKEYWELIMLEDKEEIAKKFGLDDKERKLLGLNKLKGVKV
jgi:hypothetical protein